VCSSDLLTRQQIGEAAFNGLSREYSDPVAVQRARRSRIEIFAGKSIKRRFANLLAGQRKRLLQGNQARMADRVGVGFKAEQYAVFGADE